MAKMGMPIPPEAAQGYKKFKVMGREFDPSKAAAYADSFAIKKSN